ncbi:MAG: hypothetical protein LAN63_02415 [Acidobacteriia bacterium]|nr:hypothetical protein [Terriglobia bacterium]
MTSPYLQFLELLIGYLLCGIVAVFALLVLWKIANGTINLKYLLSDDDGWASTSRFQLVVFIFVVALSFFLVVVSNVKMRQNAGNLTDLNGLPDVPGGVLALLGISASSYLVSRGISASQPGYGAKPGAEAPSTTDEDEEE